MPGKLTNIPQEAEHHRGESSLDATASPATTTLLTAGRRGYDSSVSGVFISFRLSRGSKASELKQGNGDEF